MNKEKQKLIVFEELGAESGGSYHRHHYGFPPSDSPDDIRNAIAIVPSPSSSKKTEYWSTNRRVDTYLTKKVSEDLEPVATEMSAVIFTSVENRHLSLLQRIWGTLLRIPKWLFKKILSKDGHDHKTAGNLIAGLMLALAFCLLWFFLQIILGTTFLEQLTLLVILWIGGEAYLTTTDNSFLFHKIAEGCSAPENSIQKVFEHPLLDYPWQELCPLGKLHYQSKFENNSCLRLTMHELLRGRYHRHRTRKIRKGFEEPEYAEQKQYSPMDTTLLTVRPAFINSKKEVLALIAIPDSNPDGGFLILPEPYDMEKAIEILSNTPVANADAEEENTPETISDDGGTETTATNFPAEPVLAPADPAPSADTIEEPFVDETTLELINRHMPNLRKHGRDAHEAKLVAFYKSFDKHHVQNPTLSTAGIINEITEDDLTITDGMRRTLAGYLYEREAITILCSEYDELRSETPNLHPSETIIKLQEKHPKKYKSYFSRYRHLLCLKAHYSEFFQEAEELRETRDLTFLQTGQTIKKNDPARFILHPKVYSYHLGERINNPGSWQSKLQF